MRLFGYWKSGLLSSMLAEARHEVVGLDSDIYSRGTLFGRRQRDVFDLCIFDPLTPMVFSRGRVSILS
jgi:hypothetical protein